MFPSFILSLLSLFVLATADVAHLPRNYLPPSRTATFTAGGGYSTGSGFSSTINFNDRLVAAAPQRTYLAPSTSQGFSNQHSSFSSQAYTAPVISSNIKTFSSPAAISHSYTAPALAPAPASAKFISRLSSHNFASAPASASYSATKFSAPAARITAPSRQYLSPEVETFEPLVQKTSSQQRTYSAPFIQQTYSSPTTVEQTYSAPIIQKTFSGPLVQAPASAPSAAFIAPSSSGIDTKYSADGGYIY